MGEVTRHMYTVLYQNVAQYCGAYWSNGTPTNFQTYPYKHRNSLSVLQAQTGTNCPKTRSFRFLLYKFKCIGGSYLELTTGPDSV